MVHPSVHILVYYILFALIREFKSFSFVICVYFKELKNNSVDISSILCD